MDLLNSFLIFVENILKIKILNGISIFDLLIYILLVSAVINMIKIAVKGKNKI